MPSDLKWKALLSGLGKSTLRGVKKCPKCGTYNGTRGVSCKNKSCDVVFKEAGEKRKLSTEACKLVTGTSTQVFSVRMRDKGPDYRGFVQLPVIQSSLDSALDSEEFIQQTAALCFVDSCQRIFNTNILKCHEKDVTSPPTTCQHIQAALRCYSDATPLPFDNAVFQSLQLPADVKQTLWLMAAESPGPIVQRVSRTMMAVKCSVSSKHPLGFLHFAVFVNKTKNKLEYKYACACKSYIKTESDDDNSNSKQCIHYFACICAFASDPKHKEEFAFLINPERQTFLPFDLSPPEPSQLSEPTEPPPDTDLTTVNDKQLVAILSDVVNNQCQIEVEVSAEDAALLNGFALTQDGSVTHLPTLEMIQSLTTDNQFTVLPFKSDQVSKSIFISNFNDKKPNILEAPTPKATKRKQEENFALNFQTSIIQRPKIPAKSKPFFKTEQLEVDEENTSVSFHQWLASITERINQEMHYQFDGKARTLTFQVPHAFFECLKERISSVSSTRKRLPNSTVEIIREDAVPLGTFVKYTWNINNIIHLKQIFDTPLMLLDITKSFIQNPDGTYDLFESSRLMDSVAMNDKNVTPIRPFELKTYMKIGRTTKDQAKPTPFIIEWTPNMLPVSKVGELKLTFEYGHQSPFGLSK